MRNAAKTRPSTWRAIVAASVALSFVLESAFVPLHLALNDHVLAGTSGAHVHTHGALAHEDDGHRHDGGHSKPGQPESDHEPHPAADHRDQLAEPAVPPNFAHVSLALAPRALTILPADARSSIRADEPDSCPRPPPPRDAARPRAPPILA